MPRPDPPSTSLLARAVRGLISLPGDRDPLDAVLAVATIRTLSLPLEHGKVRATWVQSRLASARAPVVVLAHGTAAGDLRTYAPLVRSWVARGWNVVVPELEGHGASGALAPSRLQPTLPGVLAWLAAQREVDPQRIGMFGYSLGSALGVRAIADSDVPVAAAAFLALPPRIRMSAADQLLEFLGLLLPAGWPAVREGSPRHLFSPFASAVRFADGTAHTLLDLGLYQRIDAVIQALDLPEAAARWGPTPVMLLAGAWDRAARVADTRALDAHFPQPCQWLVLPGHNHLTPLFSARAARAVTEFLAERLGD